ncbi:TPA: DUF445 domain-containing protein [Candidatus Latescibacteria bacterium]|nr:DUF445 domain-containing protein [Candidatus Latescibacterota bacterium]
MNKSLATNLLGIACIVAGVFSPIHSEIILTVGLFATSGAITNWLAVHMLFEKVPLLYGSGVIPNRFEEFKTAIRSLIMDQFFTRENVAGFFEAQTEDIAGHFNPDPVIEVIDYDRIFEGFLQAVIQSQFGSMLGFIGGVSALEPLKEPFEVQMRKEVRGILDSPDFIKAIEAGMGEENVTEEIIEKVDSIVVKRLDELTPQLVKQIVQDMIREHLGWLVVWGGVFGGLIGLFTALLRTP